MLRPTEAMPAVRRQVHVSVQLPPTRPRSSRAAIAIPIIVASLLMTGGMIAFTVQQSQNGAEGAMLAAQEAIAAAVSQTPTTGALMLQSKVCLLDDLDGDGVQEIAGLFGTNVNSPKLPTIVNGATGTVHWQGEAIGESSQLHQLCLGGAWLGVSDNDAFSLLLINAHNPTQQIRRALSDELERYGVSDSCFSFRSEDRQTVGFSTTDGSETECGVRPHSRPHIEDSTTCGIISTMRRGATFDADGVEYRVRGRRPGTAFLQVQATRGRHELWDETLRLLPVGGDAIGCFVAAATPGSLVVFGVARSDEDTVVALGLNAETGTERYATELPTNFARVRGVHFNGRYVVLGLHDRLFAIDPMSGEVAW